MIVHSEEKKCWNIAPFNFKKGEENFLITSTEY